MPSQAGKQPVYIKVAGFSSRAHRKQFLRILTKKVPSVIYKVREDGDINVVAPNMLWVKFVLEPILKETAKNRTPLRTDLTSG